MFRGARVRGGLRVGVVVRDVILGGVGRGHRGPAPLHAQVEAAPSTPTPTLVEGGGHVGGGGAVGVAVFGHAPFGRGGGLRTVPGNEYVLGLELKTERNEVCGFLDRKF